MIDSSYIKSAGVMVTGADFFEHAYKVFSAWREPGYFIGEEDVGVETVTATESAMQQAGMPEPDNRKIL